MDDLVKRLRATLGVDAINGDSFERRIAANQMREAADEIVKLEAINRELVEALKEVREIYAGMEGFEPETAPEGYLQNIVEQMWKATREALARAEVE